MRRLALAIFTVGFLGCSTAPVVEKAELADAYAESTQLRSLNARGQLESLKGMIRAQGGSIQDGGVNNAAWAGLFEQYQRTENDLRVFDATAKRAAVNANFYSTAARSAVVKNEVLRDKSSGVGVIFAKEPTLPYSVVSVFFGTDRLVDEAAAHPRQRFTGLRGASTPMLGIVEVSVPDIHKIGQVERPTMWRFELSDDPAKHMLMREPTRLTLPEFVKRLSDAEAAMRTGKLFVFIHGYNVSFEDAALRTAQIAVDLELTSIPVFYSWPSLKQPHSYSVDDGNATWSISNLKGFLKQLAGNEKSAEIVVIAHSLGTRVAATALKELMVEAPQLRRKFKEVVLAAPDIDRDTFVKDILPLLGRSGQTVTLYASSRDKALKISRGARGYPRAGEAGENIVISPGLETIDASSIDTDFLAHSYFAEARPLIADISLLLRHSLRPDQRHGLRTIQAPAGQFWRFRE